MPSFWLPRWWFQAFSTRISTRHRESRFFIGVNPLIYDLDPRIAMYFDKRKWKAMPWNDGSEMAGEETSNRKTYFRGEEEEGFEPGESDGRMTATTFYEPVAWFTDRSRAAHYTLLHLQIVTGRTHQIRFHCSQIGHCLVGDCHYGAPQSDRSWAQRMCLHSYQTKFMEPFSASWSLGCWWFSSFHRLKIFPLWVLQNQGIYGIWQDLDNLISAPEY